MRTIASLFESQAEASAAIDALAGSSFEDVEFQVHEGNVPVEDDGVRAFGIPPNDSDMHGSGVAFFGEKALDDIDGELADYFRQAVETGDAVLVVAEVEDDRAAELERFFREHGGRTSAED